MNSPCRMSRLPPWLVNTLLVCGSLLFFLAVLEGAARLVWPATDTGSCFEPDARVLYRPRPHCERTFKPAESPLTVRLRYNACRVRAGNDRSCDPPGTGVVRIVGLGDSFTEAAVAPFPDTYLEVARRDLAHTLSDSVEMLNLGVGGYDLLQEADRLDEALTFAPDLVTVGLLPNDLFDDLSEEAIRVRRGMVHALGPRTVAEYRNGTASSGVAATIRKIPGYSRLALMIQHALFASTRLYLTLYRARGEDAAYLAPALGPAWQRRLRDAARLLAGMQRRASGAGTTLVVVFIPQRIQAVLLEQKPPADLNPRTLGRRLHAICDTLGIPFIDFTEALETHPAPADLYFPVDGHLTVEGQRLLGRHLASSLLARGLIPSP